MLKAHIIAIVLLIAMLNTKAQPTSEVGLLAGGMYYIGDYNKDLHFKYTQPAAGLFFRYNFNDRLALRLMGTMGSVKMNIPNKQNEIAPHTNMLIEIGMTTEINFFDFNLDNINSSVATPFIFGGLNYFMANSVSSFAFPFGLGLKYKVNEKFGLHIEWAMRKTATDYLDTIARRINIPEKIFEKSYNKDWYSFIGIGFSFNLNPILNKGKCIVKPTRRRTW